jgi:hypothetical protein
VQNDCYKKQVLAQQGLSGLYFSLSRKLFDVDKDYDFVVAAGGIKAKCSFGADIYMNFTPFQTGVSAMAHLSADAYLRAITQTTIRGRFRSDGSIDFGYNSGFFFDAEMGMTFGVTIQQWIPIVGTVDLFDGDANAHARFSTNQGASFHLGDGNAIQLKDCSNYNSRY